jgi:MoaA/NifB/PqqE/SkfB family radical SAM enzyme
LGPPFSRERSIEEMELFGFVVVLTDQCNFDCAYCYEPKGKKCLEFSTLVKAVNFFHKFFAPECSINFYGGEPLLAFDTLRRAVEYLECLSAARNKKIRYSLTTNGSLLNEDILGFLDEHAFSLTLSFDGLVQDLQRKKETFDFLTSVIPQVLARPRISFETNSVFSSETIGYLSESVQCIVKLGVRKLYVNLAHKPPWTASSLIRLKKEVADVGDYFLSHYENLTDIPWPSLYETRERSVCQCLPGLKQMAVSAQGTLWGCVFFPHYFADKQGTAEYRKYCFGDVDSFIKDPQRIYAQKIASYSNFQMDRFITPDRSCLICGEIEECWVCPLAAALSTGEIGRIPAWSCRAAKLIRKEKRFLMDRFKKRLQHAGERSSD